MYTYTPKHPFIKGFFRFILKTIKWCLFLFLAILFVLTAIASLKIPSLNKNWSEEVRVLPTVTMNTSTVSIKNIRDWRYSSTTPTSKDYYNDTFAVDKIKKTYFIISTFGNWEGIAHTFFVFEFLDGKSVAFSIEARREVGVPYSTVKGLFNNYEKWYAWGSAADFLSRRAVFFNDPIYMYPLDISTTTARGLFLDLAETTHTLETKAMFYNTLFSNCTNELAEAANRIHKGSIPTSLASVFPGFADDELYRLQLIPHNKPFEEVMRESEITQKIKDFHDPYKGKYSREEFWNIFR